MLHHRGNRPKLTAPNHHGPHPLAIDDDEAFLSTVAEMLAQAGHVVTTAGGGVKAARLFRAEPYELIVTDLLMPDKEGIEMIIGIAPRLSQGARDRHVPAVPKFSGDYLKLAAILGARCTLPKPFTSEQLAKAIAEALPRS